MFGDPYSNTKGLPVHKVGDLCDVTKLAGYEYTKYIHYQDSGDVLMIKGLNVKEKYLKLDDVSYIDAEVSDSLPRSQLHEGDVVMTYIGINLGDVAIVDNKHRYHLAPNVAKISVKDRNSLIPEFLVNQIYYSRDKFTRNAGNTAKAVLNMDKIRKIEVFLPEVEAQKNFVAFAKQTDKSKFTGFKSQFIEMFGDPVQNEKGWPLVRLDTIADIKIGPFGSLLHKEDYIEGGHALVNPSHIVDGKIVADPKLTISEDKYAELSSYALQLDDIVLGRRGEMGRCAVVYEEGLICGTGSMIIRPGSKMKSYFLQNIMSSSSFRRVIETNAVGITMKNLNVPTVSAFMFPELPIALQETYLKFVKQSDKSK